MKQKNKKVKIEEEDLNKKVKENLTEKKEMDADNKLVDSILDEINKGVTLDIPEELINQEIDRMIANYEHGYIERETDKNGVEMHYHVGLCNSVTYINEEIDQMKKEINQMKKEIQKIRDFMHSINPYFD